MEQVQDICGEWVKVPPDIAVARIKMAKLLEVWGEEWGFKGAGFTVHALC